VVGCEVVKETFPTAFALVAPHEYALFGLGGGEIHLNWPVVGFTVLFLVGAFDYILLNFADVLKPKISDLRKVHHDCAAAQYLFSDSMITAISAGHEWNRSNGKEIMRVLDRTLDSAISSLERQISNFMDNVSKSDVISANIMTTLRPNHFGPESWSTIERMLDAERLYSDDGCDSHTCIAWLRIDYQSPKSSKVVNLRPMSLRVHQDRDQCVGGAGQAFHWGELFMRARNEPVQYVAVNDVNEIVHRGKQPEDAQREAQQHFRKHASIRSFVSLPLVFADEVVGILNINSSEYYVGGYWREQGEVFEAIVIPWLPLLAELVFLRRRVQYECE